MPVPFLLGADGWALFIHNPPVTDANLTGPAATRDANIPWGTFDLRGENAGPPPPRPARGVAPNLTPRYGWTQIISRYLHKRPFETV